jgi:hypothetical protein
MSAACGVSSRLPQRDSRPITLLSLPLDGCFRKGHNIIRDNSRQNTVKNRVVGAVAVVWPA